MYLAFGIVLLSVILQSLAAILALRLIAVTGRKKSWLFIAGALILMSVRRIIPLFSLITTGDHIHLPNEIICLVLSLFILLGIRGIGALFAERRQAEEKIKSLLSEKELILREVHHRIKNNMNVVGSLLSIQAQQSADTAAGQILEDAKNRVHSMALLYDRLYRAEDFLHLPVREYLTSLIHDIMAELPDSRKVVLQTELQDFKN